MRLVTKCVCRRITFAEIKEIANQRGVALIDHLIEDKVCCTGCGMCKPYVKKMLATGEVEFKPGDYHIQQQV
jgi:bacterioferritin-associated ferredoxin